ncbi:rRNA maturation RNase YbeY [Marinoscillum pacificum]|uniref:rRNA maturation RNase YbeY n=1 Tax=Marinoscillum pacificum TaxID=392723 RepID=UPI00215826D5|nr:rRNA maturation RNase YbeY [Marinoscillum pacificum]
MELIQFFAEEIDFELANQSQISEWLVNIATTHDAEIETINYIFCSDEYLLSINQQYLDHDYYTDIITFDNSVEGSPILSDIFISIDRVQDNADQQDSSFDNELHRVLAHGLLHLLGFKDKTEDDQILMRQKEDACLSLLKN